MIQVNEHKIGNLVYFNGNHNHIGTITGLGCKPILKHNEIQYEKELKVFLNNRYDIPYSPLDLKPIPLTKKWLLKFGFVKNIGNFELKEFRFHISQPMNFDGFIFCDGYSVITDKIQFVHQLQNLYFSLTNEELTLKL